MLDDAVHQPLLAAKVAQGWANGGAHATSLTAKPALPGPVAVVLIPPTHRSHTMWGWAEANQGLLSATQGLLSLLALGAAIVVAILEVIRARKAEEYRFIQARAAASALAAEVIDSGAAAIAGNREANSSELWGRWEADRLAAIDALQAMIGAAPPSGQLILAMSHLRRDLLAMRPVATHRLQGLGQTPDGFNASLKKRELEIILCEF